MMIQDTWLTEVYYDWLRREAFPSHAERMEYDGVLRVLHDIPFYWTIWLDENRAGDALSYRQYDFLGYQNDLDRMDQHWLHEWSVAAPTVLEVLLGIARRWNFFFEGPTHMYFGHLFRNLGLDRFPGVALGPSNQERVRAIIDDWMARQFMSDGRGSPFPIQHNLENVDYRGVDIWGQMNAYGREHFW
jgi:hypothetical protein